MLSETLPEGIRIELGYDAKGNRTSYRDALGNTTTWTYDALDRVPAVAYPDGTSESYAHDGTGNVMQITQASGTVVAQTHDAAGRLIARAITPAGGVEGPTAESFTYDGVGRLIQATSGSGAEAIPSTRTYDSLSRLTSETTAGKTVAYQHDLAGSLTGITYPSGVTISHHVDALGRLEAIPGVATYGYRGPDLVAQKTVGALAGSTIYDGGRRPTAREMKAGSSVRFSEGMSWTPRSLLQNHSRLAENETAFRMDHDRAGRLKQRAHVGSLSAGSTDTTDGLTSFAYDAAQNRTEKVSEGTEEPRQVVPTPPAVQNRPTAIGAVPLSWNSAGNLAQKGDQQYVYEWRNRLVRVTTTSGAVLASYAYDVFDRLATRTSGASVESTAWAGWRPIELYEAGELRQRRTYGLDLDELVRLEVDLDGSGGLDQVYTPLYDQIGNLIALADSVGEIVERYEYSPYGLRLATVGSIPPEIRQILFRDGGLRLDLSEEILRRNFQHLASTAGSSSEGLSTKDGTNEPPPLTLTITGTGDNVPVVVEFPVELGRFASRRMTITPTSTVPAAGTDVTRGSRRMPSRTASSTPRGRRSK